MRTSNFSDLNDVKMGELSGRHGDGDQNGQFQSTPYSLSRR
jgi:hypothetical protein